LRKEFGSQIMHDTDCWPQPAAASWRHCGDRYALGGEPTTLGPRIRTSPEERTDNHPDGGKESLTKALIAFLLLASSAQTIDHRYRWNKDALAA
jgi:hypothetical protein